MRRIALAATTACFMAGCGDYPPAPAEVQPPAGMKLIPAARAGFIMGSGRGQEDEAPTRTVAFTDDFFMDTVEVTQERYEAVMGERPWEFPGDASLPAEKMTWFDAVLFCNELSKT
ncbi:MAG: SUMF1/EgtB/PvdO family nonheme iron enzyme, partial [Chitinivibrionales bacterium]|nr:SUMF1/EgtB/PvdO family nonheme iron enzyme [Chitinivibrionales bacterium]MBD3396329.1 SUMF1/EgtB/PvdO family nonheme iron enzyme [Chitinivibrionales bacterium]